jgi:glycine betaine/proline transport system permease protein
MVKGLVLGLAVAFMRLMVDHPVGTWVKRRRKQPGLQEQG